MNAQTWNHEAIELNKTSDDT